MHEQKYAHKCVYPHTYSHMNTHTQPGPSFVFSVLLLQIQLSQHARLLEQIQVTGNALQTKQRACKNAGMKGPCPHPCPCTTLPLPRPAPPRPTTRYRSVLKLVGFGRHSVCQPQHQDGARAWAGAGGRRQRAHRHLPLRRRGQPNLDPARVEPPLPAPAAEAVAAAGAGGAGLQPERPLRHAAGDGAAAADTLLPEPGAAVPALALSLVAGWYRSDLLLELAPPMNVLSRPRPSATGSGVHWL